MSTEAEQGVTGPLSEAEPELRGGRSSRLWGGRVSHNGPAETLSFVEAREHDRAGSGKWGRWELKSYPVTQRRARLEQELFLQKCRNDGELWEARVVTFNRGRVYKGEKSL